MKSIVAVTVSLLAVIWAIMSIAAAEVPHQMYYQGQLTDALGAPLDTMVSMTFTIYDDSAVTGTVWWTETQPDVEVYNGLFNVLLGSQNGIPDSVFRDTVRWLGIQIGADPEINPRTKLVSVPYAFRVATVDGATGGVVNGDVSIQSDLAVSGKATIGPGHTNTGNLAFVAGWQNTATAPGCVIGGGRYNDATQNWATVAGGYANTASGDMATVSGGQNNEASAYHSSVGGGGSNIASAGYATVGGGEDNIAEAGGSTVCGGVENQASGGYSTVLGGYQNHAQGLYSLALGGVKDTLTSDAEYSLAFGMSVRVEDRRQVVFFNSQYDGQLGLNRDARDTIVHVIHVGTDGSNGNGAHLTFGGTWTNGSSRNFKENFERLDSHDLLAKISNLPVEAWQYKNSDERHIGPVSEDFVQAFDVGTVRSDGNRDNHYLSSGDVAGVALAGVKELIQENQELKQIVSDLTERIADLENRENLGQQKRQ
jgi:hypothetical protein